MKPPDIQQGKYTLIVHVTYFNLAEYLTLVHELCISDNDVLLSDWP